MHAKNPTALLLLALTCACTVGPDYEAPVVETPESFDAAEHESEAVVFPVDAWWETFEDPVLQQCLEEAFAANLDLKASVQRIRAARAMRQMESSRFYPEIDARLGYSVERISTNNPLFGDAINSGFFPRDVEYFDVGFDVSWELDVFGGTRRRVEAAAARVEEETYQRGALMLTVAAEVARNYFEMRGYQHRLVVLQEQIAGEEERIDILERQQRSGLISGSTVLTSRSRMQRLQSLGPTLQAEIRAGQYRLAVLMGRRPEDTVPGLDELRQLPSAAEAVPVGLPSALLLRRPDVNAAERRLAAATADIGVTRADAFPRFFLTGSPFLQSNSFSDLFSSASTGWVFGPSVQWNLFSGGRNKAQLELARAQQEQVFIEYEAAVNRALEEVETSLARYGSDARSLGFLIAAVESQETNTDLHSLRQESGIGDQLAVLESRSAWLDARMSALDQEVLLLTRLVTLYKALGGGWESAEEVVASARAESASDTTEEAR